MPRFMHDPRIDPDDEEIPFEEFPPLVEDVHVDAVEEPNMLEQPAQEPRIVSYDQHYAEETERKDRRAADARQAARRRYVMNSYYVNGVEPPNENPNVSLPLMLNLGWRIQEVDGRLMLVKP